MAPHSHEKLIRSLEFKSVIRVHFKLQICFRNLSGPAAFLLPTWRRVHPLGWQACCLYRWERQRVPCFFLRLSLAASGGWWVLCLLLEEDWPVRCRHGRSLPYAVGRWSARGSALSCRRSRLRTECCPILCSNSTVMRDVIIRKGIEYM